MYHVSQIITLFLEANQLINLFVLNKANECRHNSNVFFLFFQTKLIGESSVGGQPQNLQETMVQVEEEQQQQAEKEKKGEDGCASPQPVYLPSYTWMSEPLGLDCKHVFIEDCLFLCFICAMMWS